VKRTKWRKTWKTGSAWNVFLWGILQWTSSLQC
jgi:hypothetical protein